MMPRPLSPPGPSGWCIQRSPGTRACVSGTQSAPRCAGACLSGRWSRGASCCPGLPLPPPLLSAILSFHVKSLTQAGSKPTSCLSPAGQGVISGSSSFWLPPGTPHPLGPTDPPSHIIQALGDTPRDLGGGGVPSHPRLPSLLISFFLVRMLLRFSPGFEAHSRCGRMTRSPRLAASLSTLASVSGGCLLAACPVPTPCTRAHRAPCSLCSKRVFCLLHGFPDSPPSHCSRPTPGAGLGSPCCALTLKATAESLVSVCVCVRDSVLRSEEISHSVEHFSSRKSPVTPKIHQLPTPRSGCVSSEYYKSPGAPRSECVSSPAPRPS